MWLHCGENLLESTRQIEVWRDKNGNKVQGRGKSIVQEMLTKVQALNRQNFAVLLQLELVEKYSRPETYLCLNQSSAEIREIAPLIQPDDDASALSFDNLLCGVELAYLEGQSKGIKHGIRELRRKVSANAGVA